MDLSTRREAIVSEVRERLGLSKEQLPTDRIYRLANKVQDDILWRTKCNEVVFSITTTSGVKDYDIDAHAIQSLENPTMILKKYAQLLYILVNYNSGSPTYQVKINKGFISGGVNPISIAWNSGNLVVTNANGWHNEINPSSNRKDLPVAYTSSTVYTVKLSSLPSYGEVFVEFSRLRTS